MFRFATKALGVSINSKALILSSHFHFPLHQGVRKSVDQRVAEVSSLWAIHHKTSLPLHHHTLQITETYSKWLQTLRLSFDQNPWPQLVSVERMYNLLPDPLFLLKGGVWVETSRPTLAFGNTTCLQFHADTCMSPLCAKLLRYSWPQVLKWDSCVFFRCLCVIHSVVVVLRLALVGTPVCLWTHTPCCSASNYHLLSLHLASNYLLWSWLCREHFSAR